MWQKIIKLLNVIIVNYGFISNAIKLTLKLTNTSKKKTKYIFPFSNLNKDNFDKTIHGKKVKILTRTKKRNQNKQK